MRCIKPLLFALLFAMLMPLSQAAAEDTAKVYTQEQVDKIVAEEVQKAVKAEIARQVELIDLKIDKAENEKLATYISEQNNSLTKHDFMVGGIITFLAAVVGIGFPLTMINRTEKKIDKIYVDISSKEESIKNSVSEAKRYKEDAKNAVRQINYSNRLSQARNENDFDNKMKMVTQLITDYPQNEFSYQSYYVRGNFYRNNGDYDNAIDDFSESIKRNKEYIDAYINRGLSYHAKGDYDMAIDDFTEAIKLNPNDAEIYINRAVSYNMKGNTDGVSKDYNEAVKLNPGNAQTYFARCYPKKTTSKEDSETEKKGVTLTEQEQSALTEEGNDSHSTIGEFDMKIAELTRVIRQNPDDAITYFNRGVAFGEKGDYDSAIADYTDAIRLNPNLFAAYNNRGIAYSHRGNQDNAIVDFTEALKIKPDYAIAHKNRGVTYSKIDEQDKAIIDFKEVLKFEPDNADASNGIAFSMCRLNEFDQALPFAKKAIELAPNDSNNYDTICEVYMGLQQWENALNNANKGLEIAQSKGETDIIALLEPKKKRIEEEINKQKNN